MTAGDPPPGSARLQLAAIAERVVTGTSGVTLTPGPDGRWQTAGRERRFPGVTAVADGTGAFELSLHLVVTWPPDPLDSVAKGLRRGIQAGAARDGLDPRLGSVDVHVVAVEDPTEAGERP